VPALRARGGALILHIGCDLAQSVDRTAIVAVRSYRAEGTEGAARAQTHYEIRDVALLRRGLSYPVQVEQIVAIADGVADESPVLVCDRTGVGVAVVDMLRQSWSGKLIAVTSTGGATVERSPGGNVRVPKQDLVGVLEVLAVGRKLHARPNLPFAKELGEELRAFSYEISAASGHMKFAGSGAHDDLVSALCLALWASVRGQGSTTTFLDYIKADMARRGLDATNEQEMTIAGIPGLEQR
jgi:hypothetical protein